MNQINVMLRKQLRILRVQYKTNHMNKLSRIYAGKEILCKECKTTKYRVVVGRPKEKYGFIVVHKKGCKLIDEYLKHGIEV